MSYSQRFFPTGITDCLASISSTDAEATETGTRNYVGSVFSVVAEALLGGYKLSLNFKTKDGALWHTMPGPLHAQEAWSKHANTKYTGWQSFFGALNASVITTI